MLPVISLSLIVTVSGQSESWSWAEDRTEDRIVGRFVSEENRDQVRTVVDPVLGNVATQHLSQPHSQPQDDNVLHGFFVQEEHGEPHSEEISEDTEFREFDYESEQQLLTGEQAELTDFVEEHQYQYDYQDQIALPQGQEIFDQTSQVILPPPPPQHAVPQLHPPQNNP